MLLFNRILYKSGSTLTDLSNDLNDPLSGTSVIPYQTGNAIYLGSDYPFNHRYFDLKVVNANASALTIQLWNGGQWVNAAEVIDLTRTGGVSLAKSGIIGWVPDRAKAWTRTFDTSQTMASDFGTLKLYDLYWAKLTFSANLTGTLELSYVGHKFASDLDLTKRYPELSDISLMDAFESGKTDWKEQCILASEELLSDLVNREIVRSDNEVLDWGIFNLSAIHKAAQIIYTGLGDAYKDKVAKAKLAYDNASDLKIYNVDLNENAILDDADKQNTTGWQDR